MPTITSKKDSHILEFVETPKSHYYKLDGTRVVGASTISKCHPLPRPLLNWYMGQAGEYVASKMKAVDAGTIELKDVLKESKTAFNEVLDDTADIGTFVHEYAYVYETDGDIKEVRKKIVGHKDETKIENGIRAFVDWKETNHDDILKSEEIIASVKYQFGGKFDTLRKRDGKVILGDYKTSKGFYPEQFIQLGAYKIALKEWLDIDVDGIEVLRFGKDGEFDTKLITDKDIIRRFEEQAIRCRETYEFVKFTNKEFKVYGVSDDTK